MSNMTMDVVYLVLYFDPIHWTMVTPMSFRSKHRAEAYCMSNFDKGELYRIEAIPFNPLDIGEEH